MSMENGHEEGVSEVGIEDPSRLPKNEFKNDNLLQVIKQFSNPKVDLEQYPTGPHIASRMLFTAENSYGDITDKVVADFGCGCGTLSAAAALLDASCVIKASDAESPGMMVVHSHANANGQEATVSNRCGYPCSNFGYVGFDCPERRHSSDSEMYQAETEEFTTKLSLADGSSIKAKAYAFG